MANCRSPALGRAYPAAGSFDIKPRHPDQPGGKELASGGASALPDAVEGAGPDRELLNALVDASGEGIIVADAAGVLRVFNAEAERQHGRSFAEIAASSWGPTYGLERVDGSPLPLDETPLYRALQGARVEEARWQVRRPDGTVRILAGTATPIRRADGSSAGAMVITRDVTEREQEARDRTAALENEKATRAEAESLLALFENLLDTAPVGLCFYDRDLRYVRINKLLADLNGVSVADSIGRTLAEVVPRVAPVLEPVYRRVLETGEPLIDYQLSAVTPASPEERQFSVSAFPVRRSGGAVWMLGLVVRETTAEKRAEQERIALRERAVRAETLAASREALRLSDEILRAVPDAVLVADLKGNIIRWAGGAEKVLGFSSAEAMGRPAGFFNRPDVREKASQEILESLGRTGSYLGVIPCIRGDGREIQIEVTATTWRNAAGEPVALIGVNRDVTERMRAQQEREDLLRERTAKAETEASERRFRTLAEATSDIVWRTDPQGRARTDSPSWRAFTGQSVETWMESRSWEAIHPDDRGTATSAWETAIRTRRAYATEYRLRRADGVYVPMAVRGAPVLDERGEVLEWIGANQDISARIAQEDERDRLLRSEQASRAEAEAASRSKDEFLAMLGHELRNPLAPIVTALQLMKLRGETGASRERAIVERQVLHMVRLVEDLLDVSRITRGKVELRRERLDLREVISRAVETASPLFEQKRQQLSLRVDPGVAVDGDLLRLSQVFGNLLNNAAKFTPDGGRLVVTATGDGSQATVTVEDDGEGISPELLPRIFDLFIQGAQSIDRAQGGLGIGLTIVQRLVEAHDGTVSVRSPGRGQGTVVTVRLPQAGDLSAQVPHEALAIALRPPADGLQILVVDDNADAALLLSDALGDMGYRTLVAHDGPSALELAVRERPAAVLLDIGLPVMDGFEVARRLRVALAGATPLLVAVTGYGEPANLRRGREAGFNHHLVKPVDLDQLRDLLSGLARVPAQWRSAPGRPGTGGGGGKVFRREPLAPAQLDERQAVHARVVGVLRGRALAHRCERQLHPRVFGEARVVAGEEVPVHRRQRAVAARVEGAAAAEIAHPVDVSGAGDVGLGGHHLAGRERSHRQDIGLDHPVIGVEIGGPEPVGQFARRDPEQRGDVGEHHQPRDVMAVGLAPDVLHHAVETMQPGRRAPVRGRQRRLRPQETRQRAAVAARNARPGLFCPARIAAVAGSIELGHRARREKAKAVGVLVHVADELAPAEDLPHEAFPRRQRRLGAGRFPHQPFRQQAVQVEQAGDATMEERRRPLRHRVLVRAEPGQERERPRPDRLGVGAGGRQRFRIERSRMVRELLPNQVADLVLDGVAGKAGRLGRGRVAVPALPVLGVEAEAPAFGLVLLHEQPGAAAHVAVERVHAERGVPAVLALVEVGLAGEPAFVGLDLQRARLDQRLQLDPQLPLGGAHHPQRTQRSGERRQGGGVASGRDQVADRDAALRLLEREVAQVGEHQRQLLLVVGPPRRLGGSLDEDDAQRARRLPRQGAELIAELVGRHEDPAAAALAVPVLAQRSVERAHRRTVMVR